jgi:ribosomal protein S18 acetylase RimI-like enzyme
MAFTIRAVRAADLPSLYYICLKTGDSGRDATTQYRDPYLLGHYYAAPYGAIEPESCLVLARERDDVAVGYLLGARDTLTFARRCEREWFPALRMHYPLPPVEDASADAGMIRAIHQGIDTGDPHLLPDYPAHLHIDLLPEAQGLGWGRRLIQRFAEALRAQGVPGVHLGVGARNANAIAFYERVGFTLLQSFESWYLYAMHLQPQRS